MTIQNVFGNTPPASLNVSSDTDQIVLGFLFKVAQAGSIKGYRFYEGAFDYPASSREGSLWTVTGTQLATKVAPARLGNGWIDVLFDSPVAISANTPYMISVFYNLGNWSASFAAFAHNVVSGDITVYGCDNIPDGGGNQGRFIEQSVNGFPVNGSGGQSAYGVDVQFDAAPAAPVQIAGNSSMMFSTSGSISKKLNITGSSAILFGASGRPSFIKRISGAAHMLFAATGHIISFNPHQVIPDSQGIYIKRETRGIVVEEEIRGIYVSK